MVIDYEQKRECIDVSYVTAERNIETLSIPFDSQVIQNEHGKYVREYHNFIECDEYDIERFEGLTSMRGKPIKLERSKRFEQHNINYFFGVEIPHFMPEIHKTLEPVIVPKMFSCDIEIDITPEFGYSNPIDVENPIRSISFTGEELNSVLFIVRNPNYPDVNDIDMRYIDNIVNEALGPHANSYQYTKKILQFDTEIEMLEAFIEVNRKYFHCLFGWNFYGYDVQYIFNRCTKLNIDFKRISPTRSLARKRVDINSRESLTLQVPAHRIYIDYMMLFKDSLVYNNLGKYSLDAISELILDVKKVSYDGNLKKLYETDYLRFIAYAFVDTILVMLIHHAVNLTNIDFFQSYYTGIPYLRIAQNSISESLIFKNLLSQKKFLIVSENSTEEQRAYKGGFVKQPTDKNVEGVIGEDFNSLYPNSMITCGISPEMYIDSIQVDDRGYPLTDADWNLWEKYKKMGYCLCPTGSIYDVNSEGIYTQIEKGLLAERKIYKGYKIDMYLNVIDNIQKYLEA